MSKDERPRPERVPVPVKQLTARHDLDIPFSSPTSRIAWLSRGTFKREIHALPWLRMYRVTSVKDGERRVVHVPESWCVAELVE